MITRRSFLAASATAVGGLALSACVSQNAPPASSPASTIAASGRGVLTWGVSMEVTALEPYHSGGIPALQVYDSVFDLVTARDADYKLVPRIADSWKALDDTTWQFKLHPGVRFHNGDPLTAADVKFSLEYTYDPAAKTIWATSFNTISKIDVVDDLTFNIVTKTPDILIPDKLSIRPAYVIPQKYFQKVGFDSFNSQPIGSGPYRFKEMTPGVRLTLEANKDYWRTPPNAESIVLLPRPDAAARVAALKSGEVNFIDVVAPDQIDDLNNDSRTKAVVAKVPGQTMFVVNVLVPPLGNKLLRQALSLAIDRPGLNKTFYSGQLQIANSPLMPMDFAYDPSLPAYPFDPNKAKSLIQQAGYANEKIVFEFLDDGAGNHVEQAVAAGWTAVGLNIDPRKIDAASRAQKIANKTFGGIFGATFSSFYADPDGVIWRTQGPGGTLRYWTNEEFDRLGAEASSSTDQNKRLANYRRMSQIMIDEMPWLTLWGEVRLYGTSRSVNWNPGFSLTDDFHADRLSFA